jgi:hypothetical protein
LKNTLLGNTVIEGADIAIIEIAADVPMPEWTQKRHSACCSSEVERLFFPFFLSKRNSKTAGYRTVLSKPAN